MTMKWEGVKIRHVLISPFGCNFRWRLQFGVIDISSVRMDPFERIHFVPTSFLRRRISLLGSFFENGAITDL